MKEYWRNIKDYEGLYQVSNHGRVKSLKYGKEKILKAGKNKKGYLYVVLCKYGVKKTFRVHRLVAEAFIPNPENKPCIDHINTDRTDNRADNLRWCTQKDNCNNEASLRHYSEAKKGDNNPLYGKFGAEHNCSKPIIGVNKKTGEEVRFPCAREAERLLGIDNSNICSCLKGKLKSAGGYIWRYEKAPENSGASY